MKKYAAALMNFFFPGLGYLAFGHKRLLGIGWLAGAIGLTYVELSLQTPMPGLYWAMFVSVFVMNTAFAVDAFNTVRRAELAGA